MMAPMQLAGLMCCRTNEERHSILKFMFSNDYNFSNFLTTYKRFLASMLQAHNAHVIGGFQADPEKYNQVTEEKDGEYMYACASTPGKHSIFVYFPSLDKFYTSIIAIEVQNDPSIIRENEKVEMFPALNERPYDKSMMIPQFLDDIKSCQIAIKPIFDKL